MSDTDTNTVPLSPKDLPVLHSTIHLTGEKNYMQWSKVIHTILKKLRKLNHIKGNAPEKSDPEFEAWGVEDSLIMTWFWCSMNPKILNNCIFHSTAREIWENLRQTYSIKHDTATQYELYLRINATKQGTLSVIDYYEILKELWNKLDQCENVKMKCSEDAFIFASFVERDRIFQFLRGLNSEYDRIRVRILGKENLPSLSEVVKMVHDEESCFGVVLDEKSTDGSVLITGKSSKLGSFSSKKPGKDSHWCAFYRRYGHTKENCFKLHGKDKVLCCTRRSKGVSWNQATLASASNPITREGTSKGASEFDKDELDLLVCCQVILLALALWP